MIQFCREQYSDNEAQLLIIDEFERDYVPENAIWWYTRDTFLYRLLNKALRIQDVDVLYKLRFFTKSLDEQIEERHRLQFLDISPKIMMLTVYRGYGTSLDEFDKLRVIGGFLSITSFLSTSTDRNIALEFATRSMTNAKSVVVILEMQIDVEKCQTPFTNVQELSYFKTEAEVLFTMGAVFRIISIHQESTGVCNVHLKLTGEEDEELKKLTGYMTDETTYSDPITSLGVLMIKMGHYSQAERFYLSALQDRLHNGDDSDIDTLYCELGVIYHDMQMAEKALEYYQKSLETKLKTVSENDPSLVVVYNNLAIVSDDQGDYNRALSYYNKALEIEQNHQDPYQDHIASMYINIKNDSLILLYRDVLPNMYHVLL
jgi:tetratricopeptide (TPR) repeat protein